MEIKRLLYPTKFRDHAFQALKELFVLKRVGLEEILLVYIIPREDVAFVFPSGYMKEEEHRIREEVKARFEAWGEEIERNGLKYKVIIRVGDPVYDIPALCEEEAVDLLVLGKKKLESLFVSSRTKSILNQVRIPTLIFKYRIKTEDADVKNEDICRRPLLAYDFSPPSNRAAKLFFQLHPLFERAFVLHVLSSGDIEGLSSTEIKELKANLKQRLKECSEVTHEHEEQIEDIVLIGDPSSTIIEVVEERNASLIILGTSSKSFVERLFLGSVAKEVLDRAKVPVLLVP